MNCTRPGCTGVIEDGYCNVCGMAPPKAARRTPAPAGRRPSRAAGRAARAGGRAAVEPAPSAPLLSQPAGVRDSGRSGHRHPPVTSSRTRASGRSHLGAGLVEVPPVPVPRSGRRPSWPTRRWPRAPGSAPAATSRSAGRRDGAAGPDRGVLPAVRPRIFVLPEARCRATSSPGSTRWSAAWPTAAWAGSTWPGTATSPTAGSCSRACSTPATSDAMAAAVAETPLPRRGRAPEHRQDLQLRRARRRRLHRDGVRRRRVAEGPAEAAPRGQRRQPDPAARRPGHRLHPRDPAGPRLPAPQRPGLLRLQARQRDPARTSS